MDLKELAFEPINGWHAHLFTFRRRKCVLIMNNVTRYNFVMYGLKKAHFNHFHDMLVDCIFDNLLADGVSEEIADKYLRGLGEIVYTPTSNRSIISQINEMVPVAHYELDKHVVLTGEPLVSKVSRLLNRYVFLKLPKVYAGETMRDELEQLYG